MTPSVVRLVTPPFSSSPVVMEVSHELRAVLSASLRVPCLCLAGPADHCSPRVDLVRSLGACQRVTVLCPDCVLCLCARTVLCCCCACACSAVQPLVRTIGDGVSGVSLSAGSSAEEHNAVRVQSSLAMLRARKQRAANKAAAAAAREAEAAEAGVAAAAQHGSDSTAAAAAATVAASSDAAATPASQTAMHQYLAQIQANLASHVKWQRDQHADNSLAPDPTVPRITRSPRMGLEQIAQLAAYNHNPAARPRSESAASALTEDSHSARSYSQPQPSVLSASRRHHSYQPNLAAAAAAAAAAPPRNAYGASSSSASAVPRHPVPSSAPVAASNNIFNPDSVLSPPSYNATMILSEDDVHISDLDDLKHDAADDEGYNSSSLSSSGGAANTSSFIIDEDDLERSRQEDDDAEADQQGRLLQESINASISYEDQSTSDDDDGDESPAPATASASASATGSTPYKPSVSSAAATADGESSQATTPLASRAAHAAKLASSNAISTPAQQVYSTRSASPVVPPRDSATSSAFDALHIEVPAGRNIAGGGIGSGLSSSHSASAASAMMRGSGGGGGSSSATGIGSGIATHSTHAALFATPTSSRAAAAAVAGRDLFLPPQFAAPSPSLQLYGNVNASPSPSTAASSTCHSQQHQRLAGFASPSQLLSPSSSQDRRDAEDGVEHTPSTSPHHHHRLHYLPSPSEFALGSPSLGSPSPSASTPSPAAIANGASGGPASAPLAASGAFAASASLLATGGPAAAGSRGVPVLARSLSEMNMMRNAGSLPPPAGLPPPGLPPAGPPRATLTHGASFPSASAAPSTVLSPQSARLQEAYDELAALDPSIDPSASHLASADGSVRLVQSPPASSSAAEDAGGHDRVLFNTSAPYLPRQRSQDAAARRAARQPPLDALTVDPVAHTTQLGSPFASPSPTSAIDFRSPQPASSMASPAAVAGASYEASEWPADRTSAEPQRRSNPAGSPSSSRNRVAATPVRGYLSPTAAAAAAAAGASAVNRTSPSSAVAAPPRPGRPAYSLTMPAGDRSPPPPRRLASDPAQLLNGVTMTGRERPPLPNRPSQALNGATAASPASAPAAASPGSVLSPSASPSPLSTSSNTAAAPSASPPAPLFTHRIFENFLVLGCSPSPALLEQNLASWTENPKVLLKFPHTSSVEAADVADFAFPSGVRLSRVDVVSQSHSGLHSILYSHRQFVRGSNCHNFVLKTSTNIEKANESEDLFGVCVEAREMAALSTGEGEQAVTHDISCPISYCLISRYPFFELHQAVILQILMLLHLKRVKHLAKLNMAAPISPEDAAAGGVARLRGKPLGPHQVPACVALLKRYYDTAVPARGASLKLPAPKLLLPIEFQRPNASPGKEARTLVAHWCCPLAWSYLTPETLVDLLELALREFKIIVVDANLAMLSASVMSFQPLLHPLKWAGVFLPILPRKLHEFLEAPVPILVGVDSTPDCLAENQGSMAEEDMAVWYPSAGKVRVQRVVDAQLQDRVSE